MKYTFLFIFLSALMSTGKLLAQDLNTLIGKLSLAKDNLSKIIALKDLGSYYQKSLAYSKALDYFQQALTLERSEKVEDTHILHTRQNLAYCLLKQKQYGKAIEQYEHIAQFHAEKKDIEQRLNVLPQIAYLYKIMKDYPKALQVSEEILNLYQQKNDPLKVIDAHNNLGYVHYAIGNHNASVEHYQKAIDLSTKQLEKVSNTSKKALLYTNLGVSYSHLQDFKQASRYFTEALHMYEKEKDIKNQAHAYNYLAANEYVSGKNSNAISTALQAVEVGLSINNEAALLESYQILRDAYEKNNDFKEMQKYDRLLQDLKEDMLQAERKEQEQIMTKQIDIEKKENELKQLISTQEKQQLALKQSELEREKQEQDIKLKAKELALKENELLVLKRNQELQNASFRQEQLEKEKVEQMLEITRQKSIADKERLIAENQKAETARQKLLAEKERIEREKEQKAREASEQVQKAQQKQLENEKILRQYSFYVILLIGIITFLVILGLISARRTSRKLLEKNQKIQLQKEEIESQNEELHQNQEEILAQRDFIEQKNIELEDYNRQVRSSINAALMIQKAILPYQTKIDNILQDYFLIFKPRDVVSGDFFWLDEVLGKKILVMGDCTGHGVPGAFMTLIGCTVLDKIVHVLKITDPATILTHLHIEIKTILRQETTQNNSGMDANISLWQRGKDNG